MDDASSAVVIHGVLPFLVGTEIAKLEIVSTSWKRAIRNREKLLFQLALNQERSSKIGDFSSAGSDIAIVISSKDIYMHRHGGADLQRQGAVVREARRVADQKCVVVSLMCLGGGVLPYFMLHASGSSALSAFICTLIVSLIYIPSILWGISRGGVFTSLCVPALFLFVPPIRPLFAMLAPLAVGIAPQAACLICAFLFFNRSKPIFGLVFIIISLLELSVAHFIGFQFPTAVYWLPSLLLCMLRVAPVVFACGSFERGFYRTAIAATLGYVFLEVLFAMKFLPFFWLPYYATTVCSLAVCWAWMFARYSVTNARAVALFILMFPLGFQAWYRVGIPLCPSVAFFLRVLPFLVFLCLYFFMRIANINCTHIRLVVAAAWLVAGGIEATWALSWVSIQSMTHACTALFQDTLIAQVLVE